MRESGPLHWAEICIKSFVRRAATTKMFETSSEHKKWEALCKEENLNTWMGRGVQLWGLGWWASLNICMKSKCNLSRFSPLPVKHSNKISRTLCLCSYDWCEPFGLMVSIFLNWTDRADGNYWRRKQDWKIKSKLQLEAPFGIGLKKPAVVQKTGHSSAVCSQIWDQWEKKNMGALSGEALREGARVQRIAWQHPRNKRTKKD